MLLKEIEKHNLTRAEVAKHLGVSVTQLYYWDKHGISELSPYYHKLLLLIPDYQDISPRTKKGELSKKCLSGASKKSLHLTDTDLQLNQEPKFKSELFPKIKIKPKTK